MIARKLANKTPLGRRLYRIAALKRTKAASKMPDEVFLKWRFRENAGYKLDLTNPKTFNEKIQWLKLYDRNPLYTVLVDKYQVREFIANVWGEQHLIPLLGVWDDPDEIVFDDLPEKFVLKCNHDSGGVHICTDKKNCNRKEIVEALKKQLKTDYYLVGREWAYHDVPRKVIAEKYMVDDSGYELKDYKVFTFSGRAEYIEVDYDRFVNHHRNFYDRKWNYVPFTTLYPTDPDREIDRPDNLDEMISAAELLANAAGNPSFIRIDFYLIHNQLFFGEFTLHHGGGMERFYPPEYDRLLGDMIVLPQK